MKSIDIDTLVQATSGTLVARGSRVISSGVVTDTRQLAAGCLFVALSGARFNGNLFAAQAAESGAAAVLVSEELGDLHPDCSIIRVADTLLALQMLACWWRGELEPIRVIGLTGSSGKTSTKDMLLSILSQRFRAQATRGNLNNHIGVPLSVLSTELDTEVVVWEMGMNHVGEIAPLCDITQPDDGIITHIGSAHIEYMGSREVIAEEKCTLARSLPRSGWLYYPAQDNFADYIATQTTAQCLATGAADCPLQATGMRFHAQGSEYTLSIVGEGSILIQLPTPGRHMVSNSLLAATAAWKAGCTLEDIAAGLAQSCLTQGRLSCEQRDGLFIIDDSYNANLESMLAALDTVADMDEPRRCIAVLGPIGELGEHGPDIHRQVGARVAARNFNALFTVGADSENMRALHEGAAGVELHHSESHEAMGVELHRYAASGDAILFKGSRSAAMERVLQVLISELNRHHVTDTALPLA